MNKILDFFKRFEYNSPLILSYAIIALAALGLNALTDGVSNFAAFSVYRSSLASPLFYIRLFGHTIGHANMAHYMSNMLIMLIIGPMLEEKYGTKNLAIMFAATAFITGVVFMLFSSNALLGGSGLVFMLILLSSFTNFQKGRIPLTLVLVALIYIGQETIAAFATQTHISHFTHILGGLCGAAFGYYFNKSVNKT